MYDIRSICIEWLACVGSISASGSWKYFWISIPQKSTNCQDALLTSFSFSKLIHCIVSLHGSPSPSSQATPISPLMYEHPPPPHLWALICQRASVRKFQTVLTIPTIWSNLKFCMIWTAWMCLFTTIVYSE